ncbi:Ig-like domain-containing protein [Aestuariibaculum sediminum]|uniref:Choice-of-anchor D domain-containing protein n=1 Tax=Aestuariibaculum sediminum TaxID=2770637 RepID=A0A8J6UI11_9FLAO|nr:choice-of-anchor D domain-containing protein [Aestuariibaculum sediminum]MBD0833656.1 choice-of-anchor D domain-containing protein [Aestuariibaculum sediminum]
MKMPGLPESSTAISETITSDIFNNIGATIEDSNVSLLVFELTEDSKLKIKLKINKPSDVEGSYIDTKLKLSYSDNYNQASTTFPIRVKKTGIELVGDLNFSSVALGSKPQRTLTITNTSSKEVNISSISFPEGFSTDWEKTVIAPNSSESINIFFSPTKVQDYQGEIVVINDIDEENNKIEVSGKGILSPIIFEGALNFGDVLIDATKTLDLKIRNNGDEDFYITDNISFPDNFVPKQFQTNLPAGSEQIIPIIFTPTEVKEYSGEIVIKDAYNNTLSSIQVTGTGKENPYFGTWKAITCNNLPIGTVENVYLETLCDQIGGTYTMKSFSFSLDANNVSISYVDEETNNTYEYQTDTTGNPICDTVKLVETVQQDPQYFNQTSSYEFQTESEIYFNLLFDGGADVVPMFMTFDLQQNGNLKIVIADRDSGPDEYLYFELEKQ